MVETLTEVVRIATATTTSCPAVAEKELNVSVVPALALLIVPPAVAVIATQSNLMQSA